MALILIKDTLLSLIDIFFEFEYFKGPFVELLG